MKTAAIVYEFPSHSETFVESQITGLITLGCDVRIFADTADAVANSVSGKRSAGVMDRVTYFGLPMKQVRETLGKFKSRAPISTPEKAATSTLKTRYSSTRLKLEGRAFAASKRFDVIHAHFGPNGVRSAGFRKMGIVSGPIITSFYGFDVGRHWVTAGYSELFSEGDRFLALSDHMRATLTSLGCPANRITVHRLGVDTSQFPVREKINRKTFEVISVARLVPKKGIEFAIRAISKLSQAGVPVRYTIVGTGDLRAQLEKIVKEEKVGHLVTFAGPQPPAMVAEMLRKSDVLVAPSVTATDGDSEGTPVAILEASASGLPIVSTRHAGIPEIVSDGETGFLVAESSIDELVERLSELWETPRLRESMGDAGRQLVEERHDIAKLNRELLRIYEEVAT